eukprot:10117212-Alexandrium_andersonii.AAC.1
MGNATSMPRQLPIFLGTVLIPERQFKGRPLMLPSTSMTNAPIPKMLAGEATHGHQEAEHRALEESDFSEGTNVWSASFRSPE